MNDLEHSENPTVQKSNRLGQLFEVLLLVLLTLVLFGIFVLNGQLLIIWSIGCISGAVLSFFQAVKYSAKALKDYQSARFTINPQRISTLQEVGVGKDVILCLQNIEEKYFSNYQLRQKNYCEGEKRFFRMIKVGLGTERTREVKSTIFKYTKI